MASKCPNCGTKIKWYSVKAECKNCGVSIPNYNWEQRLEEDNAKADKSFEKFYRNLNMFKYSFVGTKLRIARLVLSFLPAIGFILPWFTINSDNVGMTTTIISLFDKNKSLIDLFKSFFDASGVYFSNFKIESSSGASTFAMLGTLFFVLSALFIVVAFFMILFTFKKPKMPLTVIFDGLSIATAVASVVLLNMSVSAAGTQSAFALGEYSFFNVSGGISWGFFVALALLIVAFVVNLLVCKAKAKSHEELENERLAKKAAKEAKEAEAEAKRIIEREKAEKAHEEEEKEKIAKAKARVAELKKSKEDKNK